MSKNFSNKKLLYKIYNNNQIKYLIKNIIKKLIKYCKKMKN